MKNSAGFTLMELLMIIAIMAILGAISTPFFLDMIQNSRYREGARTVASALRDARAQAVATNQRHRIVCDLSERVLDLERENEGAWQQRLRFGPLVPRLKGGSDCNTETGSIVILFNPNGSTTAQFVCILDQNNEPRFRVGIPSAATGRVAVQRSSGNNWK